MVHIWEVYAQIPKFGQQAFVIGMSITEILTTSRAVLVTVLTRLEYTFLSTLIRPDLRSVLETEY